MSPKKLRRSFLPVATLVALLPLAVPTSLHAAIWSGSSGANWNDAGNWDVLPAAGDVLTFQGTLNPSTNNDFPVDTAFGNINLNGGTSGTNWVLAGNRITLNGNVGSSVTSPAVSSHTISLGMVLNSTVPVITTATDANINVTGVISETGGVRPLFKNGSGTLTLSAVNTFTGTANLNRGTTKFGIANALSSSTITVTADIENSTLDLNGFNLSYPSAATNKAINLGTNTPNAAGHTASILGAGNTIALGGNIVYNRGVTSGFQNGMATITANLDFNGAGRNFNINDSTTQAVDTLLSGTITGTQNWTKAGAGTLRVTSDNAATFSGTIQLNAGTLEFDKPGGLGSLSTGNSIRIGEVTTDGTLTYIGSANATLNRVISIGSGGASTGNSFINNNGTGVLTFANTGNVVTQTAVPTHTLTLGGTNTGNNTLANKILNNTGAGGGLVNVAKTGPGKWILSGANTYTGTTNVNQGTLIIDGTNTSPISVAAGATLGGDGSTTGNITFAGAASLEVNAVTPAGLTTTGSLDLSAVGAGGITVNVPAAGPSPITVVAYATPVGFSDTSKFALGSIPPTSARFGSAVLAYSPTKITLDLGYASRTWSGSANNSWSIGSNTNWIEGDNLFYNGDSVLFTNSDVNASAPATDQTISVAASVSPSSVTFTNNTNTYTVGGAAIAGTGVLTKSGSADVTLSNANSYSGGTVLNDGYTRISDVGALGSGTVTMNENGAGILMALSFDGIPSGGTFANNIVQSNDGDNKLLEFNLPGAGSTINLTGNVSLEDTQGTFRHIVNVNDDIVTMSGLVSGIAGIDERGTGILRLTNNANSFGAATGNGRYVTIRFDGTVEVTSIGDADANSALGRGSEIRLGDGTSSGTISYIGSANAVTNRQLYIGSINGATGDSNSIVKNDGTGTLTFSNATFNFQNLATDTTASRTLTLSGSNTGNNTIAGVIQNNFSNTTAPVSLVKAGAGKWAITGTNTYTGSTTVSGGTLEVDGDAIPNTGSLILDGGSLIATSPETVDTLFIGAVQQSPGSYTNTLGITGTVIVLNGPAPAGYASWASTNAGGQTANLDFDNDGTSNGIEYFMNAAAGFTANPGLVSNTVTWTNGGNIPDSAYGTQFVVQTSSDLSSWTDILVGNPSLNNVAGSVSYTVPTGAGKVFVRLKVTPN